MPIYIQRGLVNTIIDEQNFHRGDLEDEEGNFIGPIHLSPVMRRHKARMEERQGFATRKAGERLEEYVPKPEKVQRCRCGKRIDPDFGGRLCFGCGGG